MMIPGLTQARLILAGLVVVGAVAALAWFGLHERHVEVRKYEKAAAIVEKQADAGTEANVVKAAIAARGAEDDQRAIDAYIAAHPVKPVRLCDKDGSGPPGVRQNGAPNTANAGRGAGPAAVPEVLGGVDVVVDPAGVDAILRATEALDILYRERQRRP